MACTSTIAANIVSDCSTMGVGGNEIKAWIFNRTDLNTITVDGTYTSKITGLTFKSTKRAWTFTGTKKLLDSGHDPIISETRPDKYKHMISFETFSFAAADNENISNLSDVVVVVESKDKNDDGTFRIYGLYAGLYKTGDTHRANTNNGARSLTLESQAGQEEKWPYYVFDAGTYAQSAAALLAMETPAT